ncbi:MAG: putative lipopolysaccharide heptosyltransferase III [Deltaproteobacteria bacterium]|nr:putative lipopolysaccharide heptosyltransferase III [Deltaproteobacteria bacterium]
MIDLQSIDRILFIKLRHIGDVLLAAGVFKALKTAKPDLHITVVVNAGTEEMLTLHPCIDEVIPLRKGKNPLKQAAFLLKVRKGRYDVAVNMTEGDRGAFLARATGARYRIGIDPMGRGFWGKKHLFTHLITPHYAGRHRAVMDMDVLQPLGLRQIPPDVELFTSPEDDGYVQNLLKEKGFLPGTRYIVIHPTSRWLFKCWRDEAVSELIDRLEGEGLNTVVTCGPGANEELKLTRILTQVRSKPLVFRGTLSLKKLASLIKGSAVFFGMDSAPMHMAAALGVPVIVLFGPSDSRVWHPLTPKGRVIDAKERFDCIPCRRDGCGGSKRSRCLESIPVEEVYEAIMTAYGSQSV